MSPPLTIYERTLIKYALRAYGGLDGHEAQTIAFIDDINKLLSKIEKANW